MTGITFKYQISYTISVHAYQLTLCTNGSPTCLTLESTSGASQNTDT